MKILCSSLLLTYVYENGNGKKLNVKSNVLGILSSLKKKTKTQNTSVEIPGRNKTHGDLNHVFVHLKMKVDTWIFSPFNVQLLGTVYFS